MNKLLFLCTANYYRSRYADILFDYHAKQEGLNWQSFSRGIATELGFNNVGPISIHTQLGLRERGIYPELEQLRDPAQLRIADLQAADLIIALYEPEHRPLMQQHFPAWVDKINYWQAPDLEHQKLTVAETLRYIEQELLNLVADLGKGEFAESSKS